MNISIQLDFEVTPTLAELYMQSTQCSFIGYEVPLTLEEATQKLNQYSQTKRYGKFEHTKDYGRHHVFNDASFNA